MKPSIRLSVLALTNVLTTVVALPLTAQRSFHNAPASAKAIANPEESNPNAATAGKPLYHLRCARCHGERGEGSGNIPSIARGNAQAASLGEYEDFMTGFVVDNGHVWGRPVGIAVAPDGSLLVTDDGSSSICRITYTGK